MGLTAYQKKRMKDTMDNYKASIVYMENEICRHKRDIAELRSSILSRKALIEMITENLKYGQDSRILKEEINK